MAQQGGRSVVAMRYDVELSIAAGGDLLVAETQEIAFRGGPFQKGFRRIPTARVGGRR